MWGQFSTWNSVLGPTLSSTYIQCPSFENQPYHKQCEGDQESKKDLPNVGDYNFAGCRKLCIDYAKIHGPGCCKASDNGVCSFFVKGKVVDQPDQPTRKAVYCTTAYHAGSVLLNMLYCIILIIT